MWARKASFSRWFYYATHYSFLVTKSNVLGAILVRTALSLIKCHGQSHVLLGGSTDQQICTLY